MRMIDACSGLAAKVALAVCLSLGLGQEVYALYDVKPADLKGKPGDTASASDREPGSEHQLTG